MTDSTPTETPVAASSGSSWTAGAFPPLLLAVLGSLGVLAFAPFGTGLSLVGALASAVIARRRPWVASVAIVLVVWSGSTILFTGRLFP
jgi:apolipoprotein N-acyltransferase